MVPILEGDPDHQFLRHGGRLRHHHGTRHRQARYRPTRCSRSSSESRIPLLTINLLQALPKTPLWDRLERENRLNHDESRDSNVEFPAALRPCDQRPGKRCMEIAYAAGKALRALSASCRLHLRQPRESPGRHAERPGRTSSAASSCCRTCSGGSACSATTRNILEVRAQAAAQGRYRGRARRRAGRPSSGPLRAGATSGNQNASNYSVRLREASVPAE